MVSDDDDDTIFEALRTLGDIRDSLEALHISGDLQLCTGKSQQSRHAREVLENIAKLANDQAFVMDAVAEVEEWQARAHISEADSSTVHDLVTTLQVDHHNSSFFLNQSQNGGVGQVCSSFTMSHSFMSALSSGKTGRVWTELRFDARLRCACNTAALALDAGQLNMSMDAEWQWQANGDEMPQQGVAIMSDFLNIALPSQSLAKQRPHWRDAPLKPGPPQVPLTETLARLQGLLNLRQLSSQQFLVLLLTIAFAEPRGRDGKRLRQRDTSVCLALRPALRLLSLALAKKVPGPTVAAGRALQQQKSDGSPTSTEADKTPVAAPPNERA